jgi:hypothetical protein
MKLILQNPKMYIWLVLLLLPIQAVLFMYCLNIESMAWHSLLGKNYERFKHFMLLENRLMWTCLVLFAVDIALLHVAVAKLTRRGQGPTSSSAAQS